MNLFNNKVFLYWETFSFSKAPGQSQTEFLFKAIPYIMEALKSPCGLILELVTNYGDTR